MKSMKRSVKASICLISCCLILGSCSQKPTEAAAGYILTDNQYVDYSFEYPDDWKVIDNTGMIMVKTEKDNVSISCTTFDIEDPQVVVDTYWYGDGTEGSTGYFDYLKSTLGGTVNVISDEEITLGDQQVPARQVTYTAEVAGVTYQFTQVVAIQTGAAYTLTYTAKPETHDTYKGALTHAISSFKFKN